MPYVIVLNDFEMPGIMRKFDVTLGSFEGL